MFIGAIGLVWLYFWQMYFDAPESSKRVRAPELEYIRAGQPPAEKAVKVPWTLLLRYRDIWPFLIGKLITDPVWWFYLFWLPSYLENERGQPPLGASIWIAVIYLGSTIGSVLGGWLSSSLIKRGWPVGKARMTAMLHRGDVMPASIFAYYADSLEPAWHSSRSPPARTRHGPPTCSPAPPICSRRRCLVPSWVWARPPAASAACS